MWRQQRVAAWVLSFVLVGCLMSDGSAALTTFGKAPNPASIVPVPARECEQQSDCASVAATSCVRTAFDPHTRCLCGDNLPPIDGRCNYTTKGLRHVCMDSVECAEGMKCVKPNAMTMTSIPTGPQGAWSPPSSDKLCLCAEEDGYMEKDFHCNGSAPLMSSLLPVLLVPFFKYLSDSTVY